MLKNKYLLIFVLLIADALFINISLVGSYYIRFGLSSFIVLSPILIIEKYFNLLFFATIIQLTIFNLFSLYSVKYPRHRIDEAGAVLGATLSAFFFFIFITLIHKELLFSSKIISIYFIVSSILIICYRISVISFIKRLYKMGVGVEKVLILGCGEAGQSLLHRILRYPDMGLKAVGFLDDNAGKIGKSYHRIKVLGKISEIQTILKKKNVDVVIFAISDALNSQLMSLIDICESARVEFRFVPRMLDIVASRISIDDINGTPLITVKEIKLYGFNVFMKKMIDFILGILIFIFVLPLMVLIAMVIKIESKGPIFFNQERIGKDGKIFGMYKFRSMVENAEDLLDEIKHKNEADGHIFKIKNDPIITKVGKFLRRLSMDELPQIINVLKGEMSLVGPRPPLQREVVFYDDWQKKRLRILPGITGLWQVSGRSEIPFDDMVRLDIYYIENWSLWLDLKILLETIPAVFMSKGAY